MRTAAVLQLLKPLTSFLGKRVNYTLFFLNRHYTPLAVLALIIAGTIYFFLTSYLFRFSYWNYWFWKGRALQKAIYFSIVLITIKILLGVM